MPNANISRVQQAFDEVVEQARNLVEAHEKRADGHEGLTLNERQELSVLSIELQDFFDAENEAR